jgi:hypothetical protein
LPSWGAVGALPFAATHPMFRVRGPGGGRNPSRSGSVSMRHVIGLTFGCALVLTAAAASHAQDSARFDGNWAVTLHCPRAPDGALAFTFHFDGTVSGGKLHAQFGQPGASPSLALDGPIQPTGDAALIANGVTGRGQYNINETQRGVPYTYPVSAHFEAARGTGQWVTSRVCVFTFTQD